MQKNKTSKKNSSAGSNSSNSKSTSSGSSSNGSGKKNSGLATFLKKPDEKTIKEIFVEELKDIYNAETQLIEALPEMAEAADSEELQDAFRDHLEQTERHAKRLEKIFNRLRIDKNDAETCEAMKGLIEEGKQVLSDFEEGPVRDVAIIIGAQKIEHYEIAAYGSLCALAEVLNLDQIVDLLDRTLEEEKEADELLSEISDYVNEEASDYYGEDEMTQEESYAYQM
jgi:ferritin-like metal-binding protein YciE